MFKNSKKMFLYSKIIAFVFIAMGITNLTLEYYFLYTEKNAILGGMIESIDPSLLDTNIELTMLSTILLILISHIPVLLLSLSYLFVGYFFYASSKGNIWSNKNIKILFWGGIMAIIPPIFNGFYDEMASLALSLSLPAGERIFLFYFGLSFSAIHDMIYGILIISLAIVMKHAKAINDENQQYV